MNLSKLTNRPGARKKKKILGKGPGTGHGKTSGKGHKGQNSRSGGGVRLGFEGGQMPLLRRLPKRGFSNARFKTSYHILNVSDLEKVTEEKELNPETLVELGLIKGKKPLIKVLGGGEIKKAVIIKAHKFSKSAKEKIEKAQGKWIQI